MKNKAKKNVRSQKRDVKQFKFSLLPEEENWLWMKLKNLVHFQTSWDIILDFGNSLSVEKSKYSSSFCPWRWISEQYLLEKILKLKTENVEKTETVKVLEEPILLQVDAKQNPKMIFNQTIQIF